MIEKKTDYKLQGKKNRKSGADFERRVRADLNSKGWIVDKWGNNVVFCNPIITAEKDKLVKYEIEGKLIQAKCKWSGPRRPMMMGAGFPDFIAFKYLEGNSSDNNYARDFYEVIGVECKVNGYLKPEEKEKCQWLLDNNIFSKILIAYKEKEGRKIVVKYKEFEQCK